MKRIILLINLIIICSGCFNYNELNNYAIATGMAIDINKDKYEVSVLISNSPKSSNASSGKDYTTVVYSGKGKTIYEAIKHIGLISPKELYIGHLSVLIISEDVAKKGINDSIEFLLEEPRSKKNFYVALSKDSKAKEVLSITSPLTDFPSQNLSSNIKNTSALQGSVSAIDFNTLLYKLVNKGTDLSLNGFSIVGDVKDEIKKSNTDKAYIKLSPLAIFKGDKLKYWTTEDESNGINIINNKIKELHLKLDCDNGNIIINTQILETKKAIDKKGIVTLNAKGKASINEVSCDIDLTKQDNIRKIENKINNKIKKLESNAIKLSKKYSTDIFGIGLMYYQDYPDEYNKIKNYDKFYNNIKFKTKVDIRINTYGSLKQSLERIENEENY